MLSRVNRPRRSLLTALATAAAACALPAGASAATGDITFRDCLTSNILVTSCTPVPGAVNNGAFQGINNSYAIAASKDGRSVYSVSRDSDAIARFDRDPATGALTYRGCLTSSTGVPNCTQIPGSSVNGDNSPFNDALGVTVSPDGGSVYVAGTSSDAVARLDRDPATGALSYRDCISSNSAVATCAKTPVPTANGNDSQINGLDSMVVSSDNRSLYVVAGSSDAVARFDRDLATGVLTFRDCITSDTNVAGCPKIPGATVAGTGTALSDASSLAITDDDRGLVVAGRESDSVAWFSRDTATGALTYRDCMTGNTATTACAKVPGAGVDGSFSGIDYPRTVTISPDGRSVYVVVQGSDGVMRFSRDPATGVLTYGDCVTSDMVNTRCLAIPGATANGGNSPLDAAWAGDVSPDGLSVYVTAGTGDALVGFDRATDTGVLTFRACLSSDTAVTGCAKTPGATAGGTNAPLDFAAGVVVPEGGNSVYASTVNSDSVVRFDREPAPSVQPPIDPPLEPPSNAFTIGDLVKNKRKGTAKLTVSVPGPGQLALDGKKVKESEQAPTAAGDATLKIKADGRPRKKLSRKGKLKITATVTFTPTGGSAASQGVKTKLVDR
jgi:6-phosphogluconolactonase (cycloisomerase 2 family)